MFPWGTFLTYILTTTITPGPNTLMSLANGSRRGFRHGLPFNFGIWLGQSVVMVLCALLCNFLNHLIPKIRTPMLVIGAAYILWLAWQTFRDDGSWQHTERSGGSFRDGALLQFVNPKIYLYALMSLEAFILPWYAGNLPILAAFALLLSTTGFLMTLLWSGFGSLFRSLFVNHGKVINAILALLLCFCAVSLFL